MMRFLIVAGAILLAISLGCTGGPSRYRAEGQVLLEGEPLPSGSISFRPAAGLQANSSGTGIDQGRYQLAEGHGLVAGTYDVTITAFEKTGRMVEDPQMGMVPEMQRIEFAEAGELSVEVGPENHRFDFDLTRE